MVCGGVGAVRLITFSRRSNDIMGPYAILVRVPDLLPSRLLLTTTTSAANVERLQTQ